MSLDLMSSHDYGAERRKFPLVMQDTVVAEDRLLWSPGGWRANWHRLVTAAAVLMAIAGAVLALSSGTVAAGYDGKTYRVGDQVLSPAGTDAYSGSGAIVISHDHGTTIGTSSAVVRGQKVRGFCSMNDNGASERCLFLLDGRSLSAVDTKQSGSWLRRYDTGAEVRIELIGGRSAPVPFLVGYRL